MFQPEVKKLKETGLYEVQSFHNPSIFYVVDVVAKTCTCPHFKFRGAKCKHIQLAEKNDGEADYVYPLLLAYGGGVV